MCLAALDAGVESSMSTTVLPPPPPSTSSPHPLPSSNHGLSPDSGASDISPPQTIIDSNNNNTTNSNSATTTNNNNNINGKTGPQHPPSSAPRRSRRNPPRRNRKNRHGGAGGGMDSSSSSNATSTKFEDIYNWTDDLLGAGSYGCVRTCYSKSNGMEYAVKVVEKRAGHSRNRIFNEIEMYHVAKGLENIVQLVEYFEEDDRFLMVFEKMNGGSLVDQLGRRGRMSEELAKRVVNDIAAPLAFLHARGIAHRDLKLDNILSGDVDRVLPVKICDFDLASGLKESRAARDRLGAVSQTGKREILID